MKQENQSEDLYQKKRRKLTVVGDVIIPMGQLAAKGFIKNLEIQRTSKSLWHAKINLLSIEFPGLCFRTISNGNDLS